jgi:hypothetical protein
MVAVGCRVGGWDGGCESGGWRWVGGAVGVCVGGGANVISVAMQLVLLECGTVGGGLV